MNIILNGLSGGNADTLLKNNFDVRCLRPYVGKDGRSYITQNVNGKSQAVVTNANATLRKDEWIELDEAIVKVSKERLRLVADLRSSGLQFTIPNGMGKTVLEVEAQSDISEARISMDGLTESQNDRPVFSLSSLPLPIIHKDFSFSARQIATGRNTGMPLDTSTAEAAGRRVAEEAEKLAAGVLASYTFGGGTIFGLTNFPQRLTKVMTTPTGVATAGDTVDDILDMRQQAHDALHFGPYKLYNSPAWDAFLDNDFNANKGDNTLRERILKIQDISGITTLDFLTGFQMILVQQTSDVIREIIGMDITTVQWETQGGMQINFKVMAIMVPQLRADFNGNTGIVHGTG